MPSGNFGNILAGHVAREMGLPIRRLILATNENDVLDEFFRTGRYRPARVGRDARDVVAVDGHLEGVELRALRLRRRRARSRDRARAVARSWRTTAASISRARRTGRACRRAGFVSGRSTHADRIATIRDVHARYGVVIDPHTADGVKVGREQRDPAVPLICIETALPVKFAATIREALGREPARPAAYAGLEARPQRFTVLPADVGAREGVHRGARGRRVTRRPRSRMRYALANLLRNLGAGLRLALLPARRRGSLPRSISRSSCCCSCCRR